MVAAPTPVVPYPAQAYPATPNGPQLVPQPADPELSDFTLTPGPTVRQAALRHENPLCRLAAEMRACGGACEHGCGIAEPLTADTHTCELGMELRRVSTDGAQRTARWAGRRFATVGALHAALDTLAALGVDESTILEHLPPNPIVIGAELDEMIAALRRERKPETEQTAAALEHNAELPVASAAPVTKSDTQLGNLLEYLAQIHALLGTGSTREVLCDRFLHALAGLVPFASLELFLPDAASNGLVIAASIQTESMGKLRPQVCRLSTGDLGAEAFTRGVALAHSDDETRPFTPNCTQAAAPTMLAIPLQGTAGRMLGVWLAAQPRERSGGVLGGEWFRGMTLLGRLLASALEQAEVAQNSSSAKPGAAPQPKISASPQRGGDPLGREVSRATRQGIGLAVLHLAMRAEPQKKRRPKLAVDDLKGLMSAVVRPYDAISRPRLEPAGWSWEVIAPLADEAMATAIAERLLMTLEDALDAQGGMEELGLVAAAGGAILGPEASAPARLRELANHALKTGFSGRGDRVVIAGVTHEVDELAQEAQARAVEYRTGTDGFAPGYDYETPETLESHEYEF